MHEPIPVFLTRAPYTLPRFGRHPWWRRRISRWRSYGNHRWLGIWKRPKFKPRLWPKLPPPLRSWRAGRYLIIEMEDDTP